MNNKEIEQVGRQEYSKWRKAQDKLNSLKAYMEKNVTDYINSLDKAVSSGDPAAMLDFFGPGGGIVGKVKASAKKIARDIKMRRKYDPKKKAGKGKNGNPSQHILKYDINTPTWSTGSKASKKPSNVKTYSKEEIAELNRQLRNGLEI